MDRDSIQNIFKVEASGKVNVLQSVYRARRVLRSAHIPLKNAEVNLDKYLSFDRTSLLISKGREK
jgi:hypothetical protein